MVQNALFLCNVLLFQEESIFLQRKLVGFTRFNSVPTQRIAYEFSYPCHATLHLSSRIYLDAF